MDAKRQQKFSCAVVQLQVTNSSQNVNFVISIIHYLHECFNAIYQVAKFGL